MCEICLKLKRKGLERCHCRPSGVFIGTFEVFGKEYISNENMTAQQKRGNKVFLLYFLSAFCLKEKSVTGNEEFQSVCFRKTKPWQNYIPY